MANQQIQINNENPDARIKIIQAEIETWSKKVESLFHEKITAKDS